MCRTTVKNYPRHFAADKPLWPVLGNTCGTRLALDARGRYMPVVLPPNNPCGALGLSRWPAESLVECIGVGRLKEGLEKVGKTL